MRVGYGVLLVLVAALGIFQQSEANNESGVPKCERLSLKTPLTYTQEKAPRDLSGVLAVVVEKVNRVLEGVVDVEVEWEGGDLHGRVGEHIVQCRVTRLASAVHPDKQDAQDVSTDQFGRNVVVQCFHIPFTILDTDECALPSGHPMRHQCHTPSVCVNTVGAYECLCKRLDGSRIPKEASQEFWNSLQRETRTPWEVSFNSTTDSSCPSSASTKGCCPDNAHSQEGLGCRSAFRCPVDTCRQGHDCASNSKCLRKDSPQERPNFTCHCPAGLMGNGHMCRPGIDALPEPKVKFDGITPTEETVRNNFYCGCTTPVIDACAGFPPCKGNNEICAVTSGNVPKCVCKPGYVDSGGDEYGCVDETPPLLRLRNDPKNDQIMRLTQGDIYKEYAVDILDDNAEEYARSLKITYSKPLPPGCLSQIGEFHVNYTVATPWTSPPYVRITRRVLIEDIDECSLDTQKYESQCPELIPQCDFEAGATCSNTIGSYTCKCPKHTSGDGFKAIHTIQSKSSLTPVGYKGGTGCVDTTKPVLTILGPNPKVFKVCKCGGLVGVMDPRGGGRSDGDSLCAQQRKLYDGEIKDMVRSTAGAELCATPQHSHPVPTDCVRAVDHTYKAVVDISEKVTVGEPVQKSQHRWSVPYNVIDDAGNQAKTVWRDVVVEEVDVSAVEAGMRADLMAQKEKEIDEAVKKAVAEERKRYEKVEASAGTSSNRRGNRKNCPPCPTCDCPTDARFDPSQCNEICEKMVAESAKTCSPGDMQRLDFDALPPYVNMFVMFIMLAFGALVLRMCATAIFNPGDNVGYNSRVYPSDRDPQEAVTYFGSPPPRTQTAPRVPQTAPPFPRTRAEPSRNGFMSPPQTRQYGEEQKFWSPQQGEDDIYQGTPSSMRRTPSRY